MLIFKDWLIASRRCKVSVDVAHWFWYLNGKENENVRWLCSLLAVSDVRAANETPFDQSDWRIQQHCGIRFLRNDTSYGSVMCPSPNTFHHPNVCTVILTCLGLSEHVLSKLKHHPRFCKRAFYLLENLAMGLCGFIRLWLFHIRGFLSAARPWGGHYVLDGGLVPPH